MADKAKHTPGPWTIGAPFHVGQRILGPGDDKVIAQVYGSRDRGADRDRRRHLRDRRNEVADAALIAAAPDLLRMLKEANESLLARGMYPNEGMGKEIAAAIAKAEKK